MKLELGSPIALGRTAEIYAWQDNQVLKLFYDWFPLASIEYEAQIARSISATGLPVPAVGDIIQINQRNGLLYERLNGESMFAALIHRLWNVLRYGRHLAELQADMHARSFQTELPFQRQKIANKIHQASMLPPQLQAKSLSALEELPEGNRLCHGDFHPGNILITPKGYRIIDWIDASCGNPLADVARTSILALGAAETSQVKGALPKAWIRLFHHAYISRYFQIYPGGRDEYLRWLPVVAAARLSEDIIELQPWLIAQVASRYDER